MSALVIIFMLVLSLLMLYFAITRKSSQQQFIEQYEFSESLTEKVRVAYPHLSSEEIALVFVGLKEYFAICHKAKGKMVAMPSRIVDLAWHEFILCTKHYQTFCRRAFGRFLHHTPSQAMTSKKSASEGLKRTWFLACERYFTDPRKPQKLPLLFALDDMIGIKDGYHYALQTSDKDMKDKHNANNIACLAGGAGHDASDSTGDGVACGGCGSS